MSDPVDASQSLSPWWRHTVVLVMVFGFTILIWRSVATYSVAPPIPERVVGPAGEVVFTSGDIRSGQQVFLKYGLMENGSIWGHGAYLGPDFSAEYLHRLSMGTADAIGLQRYGRAYAALDAVERGAVDSQVSHSVRLVEWLRLPADMVFIGLGVVPLVIASILAYKAMWRPVRVQ